MFGCTFLISLILISNTFHSCHILPGNLRSTTFTFLPTFLLPLFLEHSHPSYSSTSGPALSLPQSFHKAGNCTLYRSSDFGVKTGQDEKSLLKLGPFFSSDYNFVAVATRQVISAQDGCHLHPYYCNEMPPFDCVPNAVKPIKKFLDLWDRGYYMVTLFIRFRGN